MQRWFMTTAIISTIVIFFIYVALIILCMIHWFIDWFNVVVDGAEFVKLKRLSCSCRLCVFQVLCNTTRLFISCCVRARGCVLLRHDLFQFQYRNSTMAIELADLAMQHDSRSEINLRFVFSWHFVQTKPKQIKSCHKIPPINNPAS